MYLREIFEAATQIFGKSGGKVVRKYRCTSGSRKGRVVAKASTCTAPRNVKSSNKMKALRKRKGKSLTIKATQVKRTNAASRSTARRNKTMKPPKRTKIRR